MRYEKQGLTREHFQHEQFGIRFLSLLLELNDHWKQSTLLKPKFTHTTFTQYKKLKIKTEQLSNKEKYPVHH